MIKNVLILTSLVIIAASLAMSTMVVSSIIVGIGFITIIWACYSLVKVFSAPDEDDDYNYYDHK